MCFASFVCFAGQALIWQPLLPVFAEFFDVVLGDGNQRADFLHGGGILFVDDLFDQQLNGAVTLFIALLREENRNVPTLDISKLRGKGVD